MTLRRCLTFLLRSLIMIPHSSALLDLFISSDASICSRTAFQWEIQMLLFQFPLTFQQT